MIRADYLRGVMAVYQGEVLGEGLFSRLAALATTDDRRRKFSHLLQLESEAKVRLRPLLARLGLSIVEDETQRSAGLQLAERLAEQPWDALLATFLADIDGYIREYQAIADAAPPEDREPLRFMVRHEQALRGFIEQEMAGQPDASLRGILPLLSYPLPPPAAGTGKS